MTKYLHTAEMVRRLQQAHADHIEEIYRATMALPGNPEGIEILEIGETKVYLSGRSRLENRAIFTGNEIIEELREVDACFKRKGVSGFFEINPANFYRTDPFSWSSEMLPALLSLGYEPSNLRCVWVLDEMPIDKQDLGISIKRYSSGDFDEYIREKFIIEPVHDDDFEKEALIARQLFTPAWTHFIGYEGDHPVSISSLFMKGNAGYLAWGYTI